jgi:hypothetical protein
MTGARGPARSSARISSIPSRPLKVSNGFSMVALKLTPVTNSRHCFFLFAVDPFFEGTGRDLDHVRHPVGVIAGAGEILEALRLTAGVLNHSPQVPLADDAEQFRTHRPGVRLQETQ